LIIGAGLAGLVLERLLDSDDVVVVDPNPSGYKIGESLIPDLFRHPVLREPLSAIKALPSYTAKYGTTFVADGSVAYFPVGEREVGEAMHVSRVEMEEAMRGAWKPDIVEARVEHIDFERMVVTTSMGEIAVSGLVLDCSGPAMVVARQRGEVEERRPCHATWAYYDVVEEDPEAFLRVAEERGYDVLQYDVRHRRPIPAEVAAKEVARTTYLTRIRDGVWTWQIPLFDGKLMSYGVVSRHHAISEDEYREIAEAHQAPHVTLHRRPIGETPFDRVHSRSGIARRARTPAGERFILLSDAFSFSDPVYSVGAGLAVSQAIEVSEILNEGGWDRAACRAFSARSREIQARAERAFEFWYSGEVISEPSAAAEVQNQFLLGDLFHQQVSRSYGDAIDLALLPAQRDPFEADWGREDLAPRVKALLGLDASELVGWALIGVRPCEGGLTLRWEKADQPDLTMLIADDPGGEEPGFRHAGRFALSYMNLFDAPYPITPALESLFDALAARLEERGSGLRAMVGRASVY
jgi:flavin-dependent dehydrogenase